MGLPLIRCLLLHVIHELHVHRRVDGIIFTGSVLVELFVPFMRILSVVEWLKHKRGVRHLFSMLSWYGCPQVETYQN
jgi:hypothetical protein